MDARTRDLTANLEPRLPGNSKLLQEAATALAFIWPDDYREFMVEQDGGEGFVGKSYLRLWPAGELVDMNRGYGFAKFAPDLVAIGSDGGAECFAFHRGASPSAIVMAPFVDLDQPVGQGATLLELLERLRDDRLFEILG